MLSSQLNSRIEAVTVFRQGALVRRTAVIEETAVNKKRLLIPGLPLALADDSVRVRIEQADGAENEASLINHAAVILHVSPVDKGLLPPRDMELEEAKKKEAVLLARVQAAREALQRMNLLGASARPDGKRGEPPPPSPNQGRMELFQFRFEQLSELQKELNELELLHEKAVDHRIELEHRRNEATTSRQARADELRKALLLELARPDCPAVASSKRRVVIEYFVPGARWAMAYSLRFREDFGRVLLKVRAQVSQRSGEDWKGVDLTLSTADPVSWTELPELDSLRIGRQQLLLPKAGFRKPPEGTEALYADYDRARKALEPAPPKAAHKKRKSKKAPGQQVAPAPPMTFGSQSFSSVVTEEHQQDNCFAASGAIAASAAPPPGSPSMPPPAAAPGPSAPPCEVLAKRKTSILGGLLPLRGSSRQRSMDHEADESVYLGAAEPELEACKKELVPNDELLDYGSLRMRGPSESDRGKLRPASREEIYLEWLQLLEIEVRFNLVNVIKAAFVQAGSPLQLSLPEGHVAAETLDGFDYAYHGELPMDIPSDGAFHSIPLLSREAKTDLSFILVPRESQDAFRYASFTNPLEAPLLEGPVDIYVANDFLLTSSLDVVAPRGTARLGLGVEQALKVARNTRFREESSGLIGKQLELKHDIEIEVTNHLARKADIEVRERIPFPARASKDDVEVRIDRVEPAWEDLKQEKSPIKGGHRWSCSVEPGQTMSFLVKYTIVIPEKREIVGGNRRES